MSYIPSALPKFGEMYMIDNTTDTVIIETNVWQPITGLFQVGDVDGFDFVAGETNAFTAVADGGGGEITITATGHGFQAGEHVTISGTTNYNGNYEVQSINGNDFNITATYVATETGTAIRGDCLEAAQDYGELRLSYGGSMTAGNSKVFEFALKKENLLCQKCRVQRKFGVAGDFGDAGRSSLVGGGVQINSGECLSLMVRNITDASDLTIKHANFSVTRI